MSFVPTLTIFAALKFELMQIPHLSDPTQKLFERIDYYDSENLGKAMQDIVITKERVCLIIPRGDHDQHKREGLSYIVERMTHLDLLMADRAFIHGAQEAKFGGPRNVGVVAMKDLVANALVSKATLGLNYVALVPDGGAFLQIRNDAGQDRAAYLQAMFTPAGAQRYDTSGRRLPSLPV